METARGIDLPISEDTYLNDAIDRIQSGGLLRTSISQEIEHLDEIEKEQLRELFFISISHKVEYILGQHGREARTYGPTPDASAWGREYETPIRDGWDLGLDSTYHESGFPIDQLIIYSPDRPDTQSIPYVLAVIFPLDRKITDSDGNIHSVEDLQQIDIVMTKMIRRAENYRPEDS